MYYAQLGRISEAFFLNNAATRLYFPVLRDSWLERASEVKRGRCSRSGRLSGTDRTPQTSTT
jgi:hypothetical protein